MKQLIHDIINNIKLAFPFFWRKELYIDDEKVLMPLDSTKYYVDNLLQQKIDSGAETIHFSGGEFYLSDAIELKGDLVISGSGSHETVTCCES